MQMLWATAGAPVEAPSSVLSRTILSSGMPEKVSEGIRTCGWGYSLT